ncbi:MAG: dihydrolipoyl dehydrogenase [Elusimicrobia bacterium]|nr:dihydrolipoyl dehydrogenase [Elusimicrobiota bacterium]
MKRVLVIGAGPGGEAAAKRASARGAAVTLVEKNRLGGLCLNWGCVPTKTLLEGGRLLHAVRAAGPVLTGGPLSVDWEALRRKKDELIDGLRRALEQDLSRRGVRVVTGAAEFVDGHRALLRTARGDETIEFDAAVLATGSAPVFPPPFDARRGDVLDSDGALALERVPGRLLVVGGGAVGCEFAGLFAELGAAVTLVEMKDQLLPGEDPAVARVLQGAFERRGLAVRLETVVTDFDKTADGFTVRFSRGDPAAFDRILVCVGRRPVTAGLGLERAGVAVDGGRVAVNDLMLTSAPSIYAVGDVNGLSLLAHAAAAQAETAVDALFGAARPYRNDRVPRCLYTWPEVASVGEWAATARARGVDVKAHRFFFKGSPKALASNEGDGFLQVLSDKADGKILGAQLVGPHATELVHLFALALAGDMRTEDVHRVIFAHPTLAEGVREALAR